MAFKFNGGMGAVICDSCRIIIDDNLSWDHYKETYGDNTPDYCHVHHPQNRKESIKELDVNNGTETNNQGAVG